MKELKKLFQAKRILAMILAVAMVVTLLPTTSYAAALPDAATEVSTEEAETSTETSDVADTEETSVATDATTEESAVAETPQAETTPVETTPVETTPTETTPVETEATETTAEVAEEQSGTADTTEDVVAQPVADGEESDVVQAEINIGKSLKDYVSYAGFSYDSTENKVVATYSDSKVNLFGTLLNNIKNYVVTVNADDGADNSATDSALKEHLAYKWQVKGADGNYADMAATEVPVNAGEYKLVISIDPTLATAESKEINFEIEKQVLTVGKGNFVNTQKSGITVKEIKDELTEEVTIKGSVDTSVDTYKSYIKPLTITVRESLGTEALADETVLKKGNDYSVDIVAELTDEYKANYELKQCAVIDIKINELKKTELTITNNLISQEKDITRTYTGEAVTEPTATGDAPEISVEVVSKEEKDETTNDWKVLTVDYAQLTKTWLDADGNVLEAAPVDAGVYYFELKYTDAEGIYEESADQVKVVVEPAKVVLKPAISATEYFAGMSAQDVTINATYTLEGLPSGYNFDPDTFWGVSYNNPKAPQSYAPVFKLQMGQTETAADGTAVTKWTDVTGAIKEASGVKVIEGAKEDEKKEVTISYRLVFKGTKALYIDGIAGEELDVNATDVNSAEKNYVVDTTAEVIEANAVEVKVNASANATIDVTAMLINGMKEEIITVDEKTYSIYSKVYDGAQLYEDRAAYKKAVVKDETGKAIAKDTEETISYTWHYYTMQTSYDKKGNKVKVPVVGETVGTRYAENPADAGQYALKVTYTDEENKYTAKPTYLYFKIDKQLLKLIPEGTPEVYAGASIKNYADYQTSDINYKIYRIPGNDVTLANDQLVEIPELAKGSAGNVTVSGNDVVYSNNDVYDLDWFVMQGDNIDASKAEFFEVNTGSFMLGVPYKLGARIYFTDEDENVPYNSTNYTDNYIVIVENSETIQCTSDTIPLTVKKMGETELDIKVDSSKITTTEKVYDGKEFDISGDIANGLITVTKKNTDEVVPITGEGAIALTYRWEYEDGSTDCPINAYTYTLYVSFAGDDNYNVTSKIKVGTFTIKPRELTITPVLNESIVAGLYMGYGTDIAQVIDDSKAEITGYIEEDAAAFAYTDSIADAKALHNATARVKNADGVPYYSYLRTGKDYVASYGSYYRYNSDDWNDRNNGEWSELLLDEDELKDNRAENYELIVTPVKFQTNKRGNSRVYAVSYGNIDYTRLRATYTDMAVGIVPTEGIPYTFNAVKDENGKYLDGNYFVFKIEVPAEFNSDSTWNVQNNAIYKNNIEKAGGHVLYSTPSNQNPKYIIVAFDAAAPESGDNIRTFDIRWEDGYVENFTVDFTNAELEDDLTSAVAPKKLAFNGVNGKMIVGEGQQLDVKITKHLIDDVICLNYEVVAGEDVVSVNPTTGYVTALKKGTATVAVYPVRYDKEDNATKLDFKAVTTKITVSDVTAPKISKVYAYDDTLEVQYNKPSDGYRREIYVLEGKKLKAADFEAKIAGTNQNAFEGIKIEYVTEYNTRVSSYDTKKNLVTYKVSGLDPEKDYTVYVRNVSGIRTVADGSLVVSSAAGNVKSFKTTKVQMDGFELYFDDKQPVEYNKDTYREEVKLSEKSVKITARGMFRYKTENAAADTADWVWYDFPLSKELQKTYVNPKLSFFAVSDTRGSAVKNSYYTQLIGDKYYAPSAIAKVDKSGKIKLNGVGEVYIYAYDSIGKRLSSPYKFYIDAGVNKVTAKNIKAKVGEPQSIANSLTFYDGKTKLKFKEVPAFKAELVSGEGIKINGSSVIATQAKQNAEIKVTLVDYPEVSTTVKVSTQAMTPVKKLKAENVMDTSCDITFTHSVDAWEDGVIGDFAYKIEIRDGRNSLVRSELVNAYNGLNLVYEKTNQAKRSFVYSYKIDDLVRKSSYKISVTPIYGTETAKAATTKVNTTEMPAYSGALREKNQYGGMDIKYAPYDMYITNGYFTSGNSYTFIAQADTPEDKRATDTLTWKSSDTKVATIKANPGTYMATFKALKPGTTTIEVSSKLRKGVIARWVVRVKAVGMSNDEESGDFELDFDPYYTVDVLELTEENPVKAETVNGGYEYRWVKFTAPAYGKYTFNVANGRMEDYYLPKADLDDWYDYGATATLNEGETIYFKVSGNFTMTVTSRKYSKLTTTTSVNSLESGLIVFTAPEDNYYTFKATKASEDANITIKRASNGYTYSYSRCFYNEKKQSGNAIFALNKGDIVTMELSDTPDNYDVSVTYRKATPLTEAGVSVSDLKKDNEKWYTFTAPVSGNYTFMSTEATEVIKADFYESIMSANGTTLAQGVAGEGEGAVDNSKNFVGTKWVEKDKTVAIRVYTTSENAVSAKIAVTLPATDTVALGETKEITVAKNGETWVAFTVDETEAKYTFKVTGEAVTNNSVSAAYYWKSISGQRATGTEYTANYFEKGDKVYVKLSNTATEDLKVNVSVTKATATEIAVDETKALTVENGGKYFYTFTAPSFGLYVFQSNVVVGETGTHKLTADMYGSINSMNPSWVNWGTASNYRANDFYREYPMTAGSKVVFAVRPTTDVTTAEGKAVTTKAQISVTKVTPADLPDGEIALAKDSAGATQWYKFKAATDDYYTFKTEDVTGTPMVYYRASLDGMTDTLTTAGSKQYMNAGDTLYFKVVNTTADEAKLKVTANGTKSVVKEIPEAAFEVESGKENIYKFIVKKAGRYTVNFKSNTEGVTATVQKACYSGGTYYTESTLSNGAEIVCPTVGKTIYFKVTTDVAAEKKASVELSVEPVTVATMENETTTTVKPNEPQWFAYTVPATGRYIFTATTGENNTAYNEAVYYEDILDNVTNSLSYISEKWLAKGTVVYIKVNNSTEAEASVKLTAKTIEATELTVGTTKEVTLKKNETQWYKFTADADTYYTITEEAAETMDVNAYYYLNANDSKMSFGSSESIPLEKGDVLLFKMTRNDSAEADSLVANLTVNKEELLTLKEGEDLTITTKNNGKQYVSFTPSKTAYYAFGVKEVPADVTITNDGEVDGLSDYYVVKRCTIAQEVQFEVGAQFTAEADATKSFKVYVEEIVPAKLEVGTAVDVTVAKYQKEWFTFEAPEDGRYIFATDNNTVDVQFEECYSDYDVYNRYSMPREYLLSEGDRLTIAVYYEANKETAEGTVPDSASFKVSATKVVPTALPSEAVEMEAGAWAWYSYTAEAAGEYTFSADNASVDVYESMTEEYSGSNPRMMAAGETVYVGVQNDNSEKKSVKVTVTSDKALTLQMGEETKVEFTAESVEAGITTKWLAFKAPKTGFYTFAKTSEGDSATLRYGEKRENLADEYFIEEAQTVYIRVSCSDVAVVTVKVTEGSTKYLEDALKVNEDNQISLEAYGVCYYKFTAAASGRYNFYSSNASVDVYESMTEEYSGSNLRMMAAGETVYVKVQNNTDATTEVKVRANFVEAVEAIALELGKDTTVNFTKDDSNTKWLAFKAPRSGFYSFSWSNETGHYADVYFGEDYDSLGGLHYVKKDQTVYIRVENNYGYSELSLVINVEEESANFETINLNLSVLTELKYNEFGYYKFTAPSSGTYSFYSSGDGDSVAWLYDSEMDEMDNDDDGAGYPNFKINVSLKAGETVYLRVGGLGGGEINMYVHVKML